MRIERPEHAANRPIHEPIGIHLFDVIRLDGAQSGAEALVVLADFVVNRQGAAPEEPSDQGGNEDRKDNRGEGTEASHKPNRSREQV
ncbi:hypothetical protein D3C83_73870 [compost metagenome]